MFVMTVGLSVEPMAPATSSAADPGGGFASTYAGTKEMLTCSSSIPLIHCLQEILMGFSCVSDQLKSPACSGIKQVHIPDPTDHVLCSVQYSCSAESATVHMAGGECLWWYSLIPHGLVYGCFTSAVVDSRGSSRENEENICLALSWLVVWRGVTEKE